MVKRPRLFVTFLAVVALAVGMSPWSTASAASQSGGTVSLSGTGSPTTGDASASGSGDTTSVEFPGQLDTAAGPAPYSGTIVDRSNSTGRGSGSGVSVKGAQKAKSNPTLKASFEGLNLYQQRYARMGNQFTVEPPEPGPLRRQRLRGGGGQRRLQRLRREWQFSVARQHVDEHRVRLSSQREPRRRPELVLWLTRRRSTAAPGCAPSS